MYNFANINSGELRMTPRDCPNPIPQAEAGPWAAGPVINPGGNEADDWRLRMGWRRVTAQEEVAAGFRCDAWNIVENEDHETCGLTCKTLVDIAAEAEQKRQDDIAANFNRYVLEDAYLLLCNTLRGDTSNLPITATEFISNMALLRTSNHERYEKIRDAFDFVKSQVDPEDVTWIRSVQYRNDAALVTAAQTLLGAWL